MKNNLCGILQEEVTYNRMNKPYELSDVLDGGLQEKRYLKKFNGLKATKFKGFGGGGSFNASKFNKGGPRINTTCQPKVGPSSGASAYKQRPLKEPKIYKPKAIYDTYNPKPKFDSGFKPAKNLGIGGGGIARNINNTSLIERYRPPHSHGKNGFHTNGHIILPYGKRKKIITNNHL